MTNADEPDFEAEPSVEVTDPKHCRFHRPGAITHETPRYQGELIDFRTEDETASELYEALLKDAVTTGLPPEENAALHQLPAIDTSHRAPVGWWAFRNLRPNTDPIPWLGELTTYGSDAVDDRGPFWRTYFSDLRAPKAPTIEIDDVLLASIRQKGGTTGVRQGEQDEHMVGAGDAVRRWCHKQQRLTFRINSPDSTT